MWQAEHVAEKLHRGGLTTEIVVIETKGDKILDVSIAKIGSKGVFTEEIEEQLALGTIDIAVHSAKDMQSVLPDGFELLAFGQRERPCDVIVSENQDLDLSQPITIGTSSTRRIALLAHYYPHIKTVPVRGNLQTRISKMKTGVCDGLFLAYAGVHRMGYDELIAHEFSLNEFVPAVGQGSIAIECATSLTTDKKLEIRLLLNNLSAETQLLAERAYLRKLEGGCSIPVFALAAMVNDQLLLTGGIISLDGKEMIKETVLVNGNHPELAGVELADKVFAQGGGEILKEIKANLKIE
jgi:hydroxymethylbilane synthase